MTTWGRTLSCRRNPAAPRACGFRFYFPGLGVPAIQLRKVLGHGPVQPALQEIRNLYNLSRFDGKGDGEGCARHRRGKWLGHQIAIAFAQAGASVAIADLNLEGAENVAAGIRGGGQSAVAIHMDVTDEAAVTAGVDDVVSHFGAIDVLSHLVLLMLLSSKPDLDTRGTDCAKPYVARTGKNCCSASTVL